MQVDQPGDFEDSQRVLFHHFLLHPLLLVTQKQGLVCATTLTEPSHDLKPMTCHDWRWFCPSSHGLRKPYQRAD